MTKTKKSRQQFAKSMSEVATYCNVTERTVATWKREGMPGRNRHYPLNDIAKWRAAQLAERTKQKKAQTANRDRLEREKLILDIEKKAHALKELAGSLMDRSEAEKDLIDAPARFASGKAGI